MTGPGGRSGSIRRAGRPATGPGGRSGSIRRAGRPATGPGGRSGDIRRAARPALGGVGRRLAAAAAVVLAGLVAAPTAPAGAQAIVTFDKPADGATVESASVTVSGSATTDNPILNPAKRITLTLKGRSTPLVVECAASQPCTFSWPLTLPLNGPYEVNATATETVLGIEGQPSAPVTRPFAVAAPAAKPVLDTPKVTDARNVELSWSRNTEADMLYYAVFRKDPGAAKFFQVGANVNQPTSGTKVTFTDTTTAAFAGGEYSYQVVAVRKGASGTADTLAKSAPSAAAVAAVPVPPTTTSSTPATLPGGAPATGPTTTVKPGPPAGVDLSSFLSARSTPATVPKITVPEPPDTGFKGTLPFGTPPAGDDVEDGVAEATPPGRGDAAIVSIATGRPLVPVAGGLVLLLLALHLRLLGRRVKTPADGDLPVSPAPVPPPPPPPAPAAAAPPPAPDPEPALYDIEADADADDDDWAPPALADPVPDPARLWAPPAPDDEPGPVLADPDAIEVVEVVSSNRRPLVHAGSR